MVEMTHQSSKFERLPYGQCWTNIPEDNKGCNQRIFKRFTDSVGVRHLDLGGFKLCYVTLIHLFQTRIRHPAIDLNFEPGTIENILDNKINDEIEN